MEKEDNEAQVLSLQFNHAFQDIASKAITGSISKADKEIDKLLTEARTKISKLVNDTPIVHVQINEAPIIKLKSRANPQLKRMIINAQLGLYTMLVGPAGCGKTTACTQLAESLGLDFGAVCLTAGASETWLFGRQTPTGFIEGPFSKIYRNGGVFLADEMDAADANLLLSINTALSHDTMLNPMNGEYITKHKDFVFVAAANTNGKGASHTYTGRSRLDAATLDRFIILKVDYDNKLEKVLCADTMLFDFLTKLRKELLVEGHDDFVSTRAFVSGFKQLKAGIKYKDIKDTLCANWDDSAVELVDRIYKANDISKKVIKPVVIEPIKVKADDLPVDGSAESRSIIDDLIEQGESKAKISDNPEVPF